MRRGRHAYISGVQFTCALTFCFGSAYFLAACFRSSQLGTTGVTGSLGFSRPVEVRLTHYETASQSTRSSCDGSTLRKGFALKQVSSENNHLLAFNIP